MALSPTRRELAREVRRLKRDLGVGDDAEDSLRVLIRRDRVDENREVVEENERVVAL